jgi:branched-chain amino acid transport system permease protein
MSLAYQYYLLTLLIFFGVNTIACWSLNIQYGVGGVMNFAFIMFQSVGAYLAGVLTLGPSTGASFQQYILGATLPFPLPWILAALAGGVLAWFVGLFALRPGRRDFQAMVMLVVSIIASTLVLTQGSWFNGQNGIAAIPKPFESKLNLGEVQYGWFYAALTAVTVLAVYWLVHRLTASPWGRRLRAMRENPEALQSLGVNVRTESMKLYVLGGALASLSGAILVQFIGAWSPGSWATGETFLYFVAVIVGGVGNNFGALLGAALVLGVFEESLRYLPSFGYAGVAEAVQFMLLGVLILVFLWFRPQGLIPERRRRLSRLQPEPAERSQESSAVAP